MTTKQSGHDRKMGFGTMALFVTDKGLGVSGEGLGSKYLAPGARVTWEWMATCNRWLL